jgi:glycerophosphoryl diester phosphodiesterase
MLETDVYVTKDGVIVTNHDKTIERMCGEEYKDKNIEDYNFADLPKF